MQTQVRFVSDQFPPHPREEEQLNPGVWGRRLADYLATGLATRGIETGEPVAEDWGWYLPVRSPSLRLGVCCGHQDGDDDEFLCFTEPSRPVVVKLFRKVDASVELGALVAALRGVLADDPEIREIEWSEPAR